MRQQSHHRGGPRPGAGKKVAVPAGEGDKTRITVALGTEVLEPLRARWPGLGDQDLLRAAARLAAGLPLPDLD